ncbi:uncharacterized protein [Typha latifolia]|uniref:uncharacterized protein n=1 Tax=Typha latifolia TaxID=4733 RepID=UPI003C2CE3E8
MKRKKWTEAEEATLLHSYSSSLLFFHSTTRKNRFSPLAERVNSLHHHSDPASFPYLWSWRDVSVKIQNMRHQFLNVKRKLLLSSSGIDLDLGLGLHLWPNFLLYKQVFGDLQDGGGNEAEEEMGLRLRFPRKRMRRWEERREEEEMEWRERMICVQMEHEKQVMRMYAEACQAQMQMLGVLVRVVTQFLGAGGSDPLQRRQQEVEEETPERFGAG